MDTVREVRLLGARGPATHAEFVISRFRLLVRVLLTARPSAGTVEFQLDPTAAGAGLFKEARGVWYVEPAPEGRAGVSRVWLVASLRVQRAVPGFLVDYAAARALPRATAWVKPACERVQAARDREAARRAAAAAAAAATAGAHGAPANAVVARRRSGGGNAA
ncbi:hypothetical protein JKP88DRAFT_178923 [Tribonema minus]|uniref:Uncharacterized protein n=1 Tax=Tribonema minus TaxID=303371 RepID=A0A835ZEL5_9STRA|nr:hypothetical protein JKP88DRAFT_178923 [Tribonema minus]